MNVTFRIALMFPISPIMCVGIIYLVLLVLYITWILCTKSGRAKLRQLRAIKMTLPNSLDEKELVKKKSGAGSLEEILSRDSTSGLKGGFMLDG
jgi:hypothetical protein